MEDNRRESQGAAPRPSPPFAGHLGRTHGGPVRAVAVSPDGEEIVTGGEDGTAWVWNRRSGEERVALRGHGGRVRAVAVSPDGEEIVTGTADGTARVWNRRSGEERALAIVARVIRGLARQSGAELARLLGEQTLDAFARSLDRWRENGALEIDILEQSATRLSFNVTRCRYAEMYRALGLSDLGASLSCQRDAALVNGAHHAAGARIDPLQADTAEPDR